MTHSGVATPKYYFFRYMSRMISKPAHYLNIITDSSGTYGKLILSRTFHLPHRSLRYVLVIIYISNW